MKKRIVLVVSLVAGVLAALVTRLYLSAREAEVRELKDSLRRQYGEMDVLCFKRDVPTGTLISRDDLGIKVVPALGMRGQVIEPEYANDIVGRKTMLMHNRGDVVFWSDIEGGNPRAEGLSADIKKTMRAISINCSGAAAVSSMVRPNDHVDVIGTFDFDGATGKRNFVTCTILQNVLVLATGDDTAKDSRRSLGLAGGYSTVTLEVTPREAEMLAFAEQLKGRLVLSLRNRNDTSYEKELPKVDFGKIREEIETLNLKRQQQKLTTR